MDPLHATTIGEFAADGYTHIECFCPRCRVIRLRPISWLPRTRWASPSLSFQHGCAARSAMARYTRQALAGGQRDRQPLGTLITPGSMKPFNLGLTAFLIGTTLSKAASVGGRVFP